MKPSQTENMDGSYETFYEERNNTQEEESETKEQMNSNVEKGFKEKEQYKMESVDTENIFMEGNHE